MEWYHVCWPRLTAKRVEPVVSISWASCCYRRCRHDVRRELSRIVFCTVTVGSWSFTRPTTYYVRPEWKRGGQKYGRGDMQGRRRRSVIVTVAALCRGKWSMSRGQLERPSSTCSRRPLPAYNTNAERPPWKPATNLSCVSLPICRLRTEH